LFFSLPLDELKKSQQLEGIAKEFFDSIVVSLLHDNTQHNNATMSILTKVNNPNLGHDRLERLHGGQGQSISNARTRQSQMEARHLKKIRFQFVVR
jgi:hypothetical protein